MPKQTIVQLLDDYDGKALPEDTKPVNLSLGRTTYALYLSEDNHGKLLEALEPFIKDAETVSTTAGAPRAAKAADDADKAAKAAARKWAVETGYKFKGADGEERTLGDRGRIPDVVMKAWETAGKPGL